MNVVLSKLGDKATIIMGQSPPGDSYNKEHIGTPLLNGPTEFGLLHPTEKQWTTSPTKLCQPGDVLFCVRGATAGRLNVADKEYCLGRGLAAIRGNHGKLDSGFLRHILMNGYAKFQARGVGSTFINISNEDLANFEVPLLRLAEQERVSRALDHAEALRAKRQEALSQLDALIHAMFLELFGDPRLNEKNWATSQIGSVISDMRGGASLEPEDFVDSGFPILHKGAIKPNGAIVLDVKKKTFAPREYAAANGRCQVDRTFMAVTLRDLVPTGPSIGLVVDLRNGPYDEYLLAQGAYGFHLKPEKALAEYFVYLSNMQNFRHVLRKYSVGSTQIHIRTPVYLDISIPLPPLELQKQFASRVAAVDRVRKAQQASLLELNALFSSVQGRAFTGQIFWKI